MRTLLFELQQAFELIQPWKVLPEIANGKGNLLNEINNLL